MSKDNARRFCEEFIRNEEMQKKSKRYITCKDDLIRFAEKEGFNFTSEDLDEYAAEIRGNTAALTDDELDTVTAGLQTTGTYGCGKWEPGFIWSAAEGQCGSCKHWRLPEVNGGYEIILQYLELPGRCGYR